MIAQDDRVRWQYRARWVVDHGGSEGCALPAKTLYSSAGVSAGIDMTLGFLSDRHDPDTARKIARHMEYLWNEDPADDPFA